MARGSCDDHYSRFARRVNTDPESAVAAWHLKRWQRVVVDVGGVFFQLVVGAIYIFLYALYGWNSLRVAAVMILANGLFSMNPILKFDGYWIVADALGVPRQAAAFFTPLVNNGAAPNGASIHTFFVSTYMIFLMLFISTRMFRPLVVSAAGAARRLAKRSQPQTPDAA